MSNLSDGLTNFCDNCHGPIYMFAGHWRHSFTESQFCGMRDRPALVATPVSTTGREQ